MADLSSFINAVIRLSNIKWSKEDCDNVLNAIKEAIRKANDSEIE